MTPHTQCDEHNTVLQDRTCSLRVLLSKSCKTISETVHHHGTDGSLLLFLLHKSEADTPVNEDTVTYLVCI